MKSPWATAMGVAGSKTWSGNFTDPRMRVGDRRWRSRWCATRRLRLLMRASWSGGAMRV